MWNELAVKHHDWVERMGWHNKTILESLALIGSEVGEAAHEYIVDRDNLLAEELADIMLRSIDLLHSLHVDIDQCIQEAAYHPWECDEVPDLVMEIMVDFAKAVNAARSLPVDLSFNDAMGRIMKRVMLIAEGIGDVVLYDEVVQKMKINEQRGTRGRIK